MDISSDSAVNSFKPDFCSVSSSRRKEGRLATFIPAQINNSNHGQPITCEVICLSKSGARLKLANMQDLPNTFKLTILAPKKELECQLVWAGDSKLGLEFLR